MEDLNNNKIPDKAEAKVSGAYNWVKRHALIVAGALVAAGLAIYAIFSQ